MQNTDKKFTSSIARLVSILIVAADTIRNNNSQLYFRNEKDKSKTDKENAQIRITKQPLKQFANFEIKTSAIKRAGFYVPKFKKKQEGQLPLA